MDELESIILSALFVSQEALSINEIYRVLNKKYILDKKMKKISKEGIVKTIDEINKKIKEYNLPFEIKKLPNEKYDLTIQSKYFRYVEDLAPYKEFSRATLQTLALIAYKSPIKQKDVIEIRGYRAHEQIKELIERGFVKAEKTGNVKILKITKKFLDYFGLKNEKELKEFFESKAIKEEDFGDNSGREIRN